MQEYTFDNKHILPSKNASELVKAFFQENFPLYMIEKDYITSTGQWGVEFVHLNNKILISSDRGYLDTEIMFNNAPISLSNYEPAMENAKVSSEQNICLVLNVVKEILKMRQT